MTIHKSASPQNDSDQAPPPGGTSGEQVELTIDWKYSGDRIFSTGDPNYFWVENYGSGRQLAPNGEYVSYANHYLHSFCMENGLIKEYREFTNPVNLWKAFGLQLPHVPTPDETMQAALTARKAKKASGQ
jgi:hypothetical protein